MSLTLTNEGVRVINRFPKIAMTDNDIAMVAIRTGHVVWSIKLHTAHRNLAVNNLLVFNDALTLSQIKTLGGVSHERAVESVVDRLEVLMIRK